MRNGASEHHHAMSTRVMCLYVATLDVRGRNVTFGRIHVITQELVWADVTWLVVTKRGDTVTHWASGTVSVVTVFGAGDICPSCLRQLPRLIASEDVSLFVN